MPILSNSEQNRISRLLFFRNSLRTPNLVILPADVTKSATPNCPFSFAEYLLGKCVGLKVDGASHDPGFFVFERTSAAKHRACLRSSQNFENFRQRSLIFFIDRSNEE
jgi:hypothetical protein